MSCIEDSKRGSKVFLVNGFVVDNVFSDLDRLVHAVLGPLQKGGVVFQPASHGLRGCPGLSRRHYQTFALAQRAEDNPLLFDGLFIAIKGDVAGELKGRALF